MTQVKTVPIDPSVAVKRKVAFGVTAVFITQFVSFIFINARNIAQPQMIAEFDGMSLFAWLIAMPALAGSASTLLFGKLSDMYGRRAVLLISMAIFGVGLVLTTQVTSMAGLVTAATFMSIGHFPIVPLCFSVIGDLFSAAERARWTGLLNLPTGIAATIGPVLGGVVAESMTGWRGLYWGTVPLLLIAGILVVMAFPKHAAQVKPKVDVAGTAVMIIAVATLIFGFSWIGQPARLMAGVVLLVVSVAAWWGFIAIERKPLPPFWTTGTVQPHVSDGGGGEPVLLLWAARHHGVFTHLCAGSDGHQPHRERLNVDTSHHATGLHGHSRRDAAGAHG